MWGMRLNYIYKKNSIIKKLLQELEVIKKVVDLLPRLPHVEENLRRKSLLKSSLFSARIEGNRLQLRDVQNIYKSRDTKNFARTEVFNILKALRWLFSNKAPRKLTLRLIIKLHKIVMSDLTADAGRFRTEPSSIFNQAGVAIYLPPPPTHLFSLVKKLIKITNSSKNPGPIKAAICHFAFEKIHPFLDGNGRVGRLLSSFILKNSGFSFRGLISLEEYFEDKRQDYYYLLTNKKPDITDFVEFYLVALDSQAQKLTKNLKNIKEELPEDRLLPRRQEILQIVKDHEMVSFDFLKRRFAKIPPSSLHYDLKKMVEAGFIKKLGTTRGVMYEANQLLL